MRVQVVQWLPFPLQQIARVNAVNLERERKIKAGLPVPTSLTEDAKSGELKLPFTKVQ